MKILAAAVAAIALSIVVATPAAPDLTESRKCISVILPGC